jgi:two-component system, OmpR family, response regulator QseB
VRILLLEDEPDIAEAVVDALTRDRHHVAWAPDLAAAEAALAARSFDLAVLDVIIGGDDDAGFRLAASMRHSGFLGPVLFTTARDAVDDRVRGLDLGGDDYLVKPYSLAELQARVRALLRRETPVKGADVTHGPLRIDLAAQRVWWDDREVDLSARAFALVALLALHPDRTFGALELQERVFPDAASGGIVVRVYVRQLRQKLGPAVVATVAGGYRLGVA